MAVKSKAKPTGAGGFCAYIGPSIRGVIQHGTIYRGNKQDVLNGNTVRMAVQKYPEISDLIVPGKSLAAAREKINTPGNLLYVRYRALIDRAKKEEKL